MRNAAGGFTLPIIPQVRATAATCADAANIGLKSQFPPIFHNVSDVLTHFNLQGRSTTSGNLTAASASVASNHASNAATVSASVEVQAKISARELLDRHIAGDRSPPPEDSLGGLPVMLQRLVMQCCSLASLLTLARCSRALYRAADHPFAWQFSNAVLARPDDTFSNYPGSSSLLGTAIAHQYAGQDHSSAFAASAATALSTRAKMLYPIAAPLAGRLSRPQLAPASSERRSVVLQSVHALSLREGSLIALHAQIVWVSLATNRREQAYWVHNRGMYGPIAWYDKDIHSYFPVYDAQNELAALRCLHHLHTLILSYLSLEIGGSYIKTAELASLLSAPRIKDSLRVLILQSPSVGGSVSTSGDIPPFLLPLLKSGGLLGMDGSLAHLRLLLLQSNLVLPGFLLQLPKAAPQLEQLVWIEPNRHPPMVEVLAELPSVSRLSLHSLSLVMSKQWSAVLQPAALLLSLPSVSGAHRSDHASEVLSSQGAFSSSSDTITPRHLLLRLIAPHQPLTMTLRVLTLAMVNRQYTFPPHIWPLLLSSLCVLTVLRVECWAIDPLPLIAALPMSLRDNSSMLEHLVLVDNVDSLDEGMSYLFPSPSAIPGVLPDAPLAIWEHFLGTDIPASSPLQVHVRVGAGAYPYGQHSHQELLSAWGFVGLVQRHSHRLRLWADSTGWDGWPGSSSSVLSRGDMLGEFAHGLECGSIPPPLPENRQQDLRQRSAQLFPDHVLDPPRQPPSWPSCLASSTHTAVKMRVSSESMTC